MLDAIVKRQDFLDLVEELKKKRRIIGPVERNGRYFYDEVDSAAKLELSFNYCVYSPRGFLFPPTETLFNFSRDNGGFSAAPTFEARPTALIGVHPCDLHAMRLLDHVFGTQQPDEHYLSRRRETLVVGIDCPTPCTQGIFCVDMQTNAISAGFDVMLYPLGSEGESRFGVVFGTPAGREWLQYSRRCVKPSATDERELAQYQRTKTAAFEPALKTPAADLPSLLDRSYDSLLWEATARRCYSCGSCNLSCPTCYCFNMYDELDVTLKSGRRKREWDGCQLKGFALVAGGHNFRPQAGARLRHRIYRKAKWIRERTGLTGCVGCARCDRACTAKINSVDIYNQLAEEV